jgi:hypothetical protein
VGGFAPARLRSRREVHVELVRHPNEILSTSSISSSSWRWVAAGKAAVRCVAYVPKAALIRGADSDEYHYSLTVPRKGSRP